MRLSLMPLATSPQTDSVVAVAWNSSNELYSCGRDHTIWRWDRNGEASAKICTCAGVFTDMHWYPVISPRHRGVSNKEMFAIGFSDGTFSFISKGGREERRIEAHKGAILSLKWNFEGTAIATGGEDGFVKLWSRNGMLRLNLSQNEQAVYALAWAPESGHVVFACGKKLVIKPLQCLSKHIQWDSHEGLVTRVDWNRANNLIVSLGQEGCYKVWDSFGRLSYKGENFGFCLTSVSWCPSGDLFALSTHKMIILCDKSGRILSKEKIETGSLNVLQWSINGSKLAMGCTNGVVYFGHLIDRQVEWLKLTATLKDPNHVHLQNYLQEEVKQLDFQEAVINMCLGFGHLIIITMCQCFVYSTEEWGAPYVIDMKDACIILKQSIVCFLVADFLNELQLYTYNGKKLSNPDCPGVRVDLLNNQIVSLSSDTLAVVDCNELKTIYLLDTTTGKVFTSVLHQTAQIVEVGLNHQGSKSERILVFMDAIQDLYFTSVFKVCIRKLASMTTKAIWSAEADILSAIVDQNLVIFYYPQALFVDEDLFKFLKLQKECLQGKKATILRFQGSLCSIQYQDGAVVTISISSVPLLLFQYIANRKWDQAKKLCWIFKENSLWASVAAAAMNCKDFSVAEEAYTALQEVHKVEFIKHIKSVSLDVVCQAEYELFRRQDRDAESLLLQSGLIYRAIKLNLRLFNWDRALELALQHQKHVDTVLWKRDEYLLGVNQKETKESFLNLKDQVPIDVDKIKEAIAEDKANERTRRGSKD